MKRTTKKLIAPVLALAVFVTGIQVMTLKTPEVKAVRTRQESSHIMSGPVINTRMWMETM